MCWVSGNRCRLHSTPCSEVISKKRTREYMYTHNALASTCTHTHRHTHSVTHSHRHTHTSTHTHTHTHTHARTHTKSRTVEAGARRADIRRHSVHLHLGQRQQAARAGQDDPHIS